MPYERQDDGSPTSPCVTDPRPTGYETTYEYDALNRLVKLTDAEGGVQEFTSLGPDPDFPLNLALSSFFKVQ